jgi:hypothetical protein
MNNLFSTKVEWTVDNTALRYSERFFIEYFEKEENAVFVIRDVKKDDAGYYTITAQNSAGFKTSTARLSVLTQPSIDDTSYINPDAFQKFESKQPNKEQNVADAGEVHIKIIEPLVDARVVEGSQAVFSCVVDANPKAEA